MTTLNTTPIKTTEITEKIEALLVRLRKEAPSFELQDDVAAVVTENLERVRESFGNWEKDYIARAISALTKNRTSTKQPTSLALRRALQNAEKALTPKRRRNEQYDRKEKALNAFNYKRLAAALRQIQATT